MINLIAAAQAAGKINRKIFPQAEQLHIFKK